MAFRGCLVKKASDQTAANYSGSPNITWDSEVYDTDAFHSTVTNTDLITIPSGANGKYGILTVCLSLSSVTAGSSGAPSCAQSPFGTPTGRWAGATRTLSGNGQATTSAWMQATTGPMLLSTGNQFYSGMYNSDTSITVESESSLGLYVLDSFSETMRCLARLSTNLTGQDFSTPAAVPFDGADVFDTNSIHSPSSNNTKLIIPSALNGKYVRVWAQIKASSVTAGSTHSLAIRKTGSLTYDGFGGNSGNTAASEAWTQCQTQIIQASTGDEFEALYYNSDNSITLEAGACALGLWVVGS